MTHLQKLRTPPILKWLSSRFSETHQKSSKTPYFCASESLHSAQNHRFCSNTALLSVNHQILDEIPTPKGKTMNNLSRVRRAETQVALLEYLHNTRCLSFPDAEYISKNSPSFIRKLLNKIEIGEDFSRSLTRLFNRYPINEFEPFLESLGLKPSEFASILPRSLMFLTDDRMLLPNYYVLCDYGIARSKIGKICKEAMEVFGYDHGVLGSKLRAYEEVGLNQSTVCKVVASDPNLLVGSVDLVFVRLLEELKSLGIDYDWIEGCLSERNSYSWNQMLRLVCFFNEMGFSKEQLAGLLKKHPGLLFEVSGNEAFSVIGLLLKLGSRIRDISLLFLRFPRLQDGTFIRNFRQGLFFLIEIEMEPEEIRKIVYNHPLMLGSQSLKKSSSVVSRLNITKKLLCGILKKEPLQLRNYILGNRIDPLPKSREDEKSLIQKTKFFLNLGFVENSDEMRKALKFCRGKGGELQERFQCLVQAGIDEKDVSKMVKEAPQILNQSRDMIEMKVDFVKNGLGYPNSDLVSFPSFICYGIERFKLRFSIYGWLKDEGTLAPMMSLGTILASSEKQFLKKYVSRHPRGPEVWEKLKTTLLSS